MALSIGVAAPAAAETLTVPVGRPAVSDAVAALDTISIQQFGGRDGAAAAVAIEDALRAAGPDGRPWLRVVPAGVKADVKGGLYGSVESDIKISSRYQKTKEECRDKDKDGNCTAKETRKIDCKYEQLTLRPTLRLTDAAGALLYSDEKAMTDTRQSCADGVQPDWSRVRRKLVAELAERTVAALTPALMRQNIRVMENRRGLDKTAATAFKDALHLTKRDQEGACRVWRTMGADSGNQPSVAFNIGLCAEHDGDLETARRQYERVANMTAGRGEANEGLRRIDDTIRANRQFAARTGG
ncbi:hypothetical protein IDJ81_07860 [Tsuneonella flava]|uniref:Tetratricopeptide repeat protein n=1 Tax=Tsuneonella flava TaxID=2055955 RepID=A0ABX7K811_9SPHN|nr:hypothetical protein [Tsuneonella flava]QSB43331.1 hypothetical protein IDJ81_07860 [Tsuneonella flava]